MARHDAEALQGKKLKPCDRIVAPQTPSYSVLRRQAFDHDFVFPPCYTPFEWLSSENVVYCNTGTGVHCIPRYDREGVPSTTRWEVANRHGRGARHICTGGRSPARLKRGEGALSLYKYGSETVNS